MVCYVVSFRLFRVLLSLVFWSFVLGLSIGLLFFFLPHLICRLLCLWKAARKFKEGRKETKMPFNSNFIFLGGGFNNYFVSKEILPETS